MKQFKLNNVEQGTVLIKSLWPKMKSALESGKELCLTVEEAHRSDDQNKKYHAIIAEIAKQAQHMGAHWDAEDFKRLLVDQFVREIGLPSAKVIPNLDGTGIVQLGFQTRKFTKEQGSQFIEWLNVWCVTNGISLKEE